MSKKNLQVEETELDDDFDSLDFEMGFEGLSDDREPKSKPLKSFAKGVQNGLTDTTLIKNIIKNNLPKEYGDTFDMLDEVASGTRQFADDVVKQAKPIIGDLAGAAEKFLPSNFKATKEKLNNIKKWTEGDPSRQGPSKEAIRENSLGIELGRIFEQQQKVDQINDKIEKRERALDRGLEMAQHKDILSVLTNLANTSSQTAAYTTTINSAWQRKSLESQYRQLFTLQDILEETKLSNAKIIGNLEVITKNSALPEYRKTQRDEAFMEEARRRFSGKIVDASTGFFKRGLQKMRDDVGSTFSDIANMTSMLAVGADMHAMEQEFDPKTLKDTFAEAGGGKVGQWILSKIGGKLVNGIKQNPNVVNKIVKGQNFIKSFQTDGIGLIKDQLGKHSENDGLLGALASYFDNTFQLNQANNTLMKYNAQDMYKPSPFTNKVAYSITDIIPGYLARILQEQTMQRTGSDKVDLVKFDFRKGKFDSTTDIIKSIQKDLSPESLSGSADYYFRDIMSRIEDVVDLTDDERNQIAKALLEKGISGTSLNPEKMTDTDHWANTVKDYSAAEKAASAMKSIYGTESDKEFYSFNMDAKTKANANDFISKVKNLRYLQQDLYTKAQFLVDNGLIDEAEAAELLKGGNLNTDLINTNTTKLKGSFKGKLYKTVDLEQEFADKEIDLDGHDKGLVQKFVNKVDDKLRKVAGKERVDDEGYIIDSNGKRILDKDGNPRQGGTSDVHAKENITKPGNVLDKLNRLPIFNWSYKKGRGDSGATENMGPMAQDLNKEFGEEVAPTGKTIDLVNANGVAMKAIQELSGKVDSTVNTVKGLFGSDKEPKGGESSYLPQSGLECLRGIYYNTTALMNQGNAMINISSESLKNLAVGLGTQLGKIDLSEVSEEIQKKYQDSIKFVKDGKASTLLGSLGDTISNLLGETLSSGYDRAKRFLKGGYTEAKSLMNFISGEAGDIYDKAKIAALETFDVYVKGETEPRMISHKIKQGYYIDFAKQTPIRTRKDIASTENGIIEINTDGSQEFVLLKSELENTYFVNKHKNFIERAIRGTGNFIFGNAKATLESFIKPSFKLGSDIMSSVKNTALKFIDEPIDIFVKDKLETPVILAKKMRDGLYIDFHDGTTIERPSQIKGAVFDKEKNEIVLTNDEFRIGIVDIYNKPIKSAIGRFTRNALGLAVGIGSSTMSWTLKKLSSAPGMLGKLMGKGSELLGKLGLPKFDIGGLFGGESTDILKDIRDILRYQSGLGPKPGTAVTSAAKTVQKSIAETVNKFSDKAANDEDKVTTEKAKDEDKKESIFAKMSNKIKSFTQKKTQNVNDKKELVDQPVPTEYATHNSLLLAAGAAGTLLNGATNLLTDKKKTNSANDSDKVDDVSEKKKESILERINNKIQSIKEKADIKKQGKESEKKITNDGLHTTEDGLRVGSWQEKEKNHKNINEAQDREKAKVRVYATKNIFEMIASVVGGIKDKLKDWMGRKGDPADLAKDIADSAGDGPDRGKNEKPGKKPGRLRRMGSLGIKTLGAAGAVYGAYSAYDSITKGNYGDAAVEAGMAAVGAGVTVGGIGATASAIGTGLAVLGGASLAVLLSPITWTAVGIAGVLYGSYKAYEYITRKEFKPSEKMRMIEYGLRGGDEAEMRKIYELEQYVESVSKTTSEEWVIDEKKCKAEEMLAIFDIDKKDPKRVDNFTSWFIKRFKPIFGKWKLLVKQIGGSDKIEWLETASGSKLLDIYKAFKITPSAYEVKASPFGNIKLNTDSSVITNYKDEWLLSLKNDAIKNKDDKTGKAVAATGAAIIEARKQGANEEAVANSLSTNGIYKLDTGDRSVNSAKQMVKVEGKFDDFTITGSVAAFDAIKWKTYGLNVLNVQRVKALRNLESVIEDNVKIDSNGHAVFDGDIKDIIRRAAGYFGLTEGDEETKKWVIWFNNRFLKVYLTMCSAIFAYTKRTDIKNNYRFLEVSKASEKLTIARAMMGCVGIWAIKEFAFKNSVANTNANSCDENILFLESQAKDEVLQEQKTSNKPVDEIPQAVKNKPVTNKTNATGLDAVKQSTTNTTPTTIKSDTKGAASAMGLDEVEDKSYTDSAPGSTPVAKTISNGSVGSLVNAPGDLSSGAGAMQYIKLADGANINGLHPSVKRLFLGMVEEYGQMTGKSVQVNTAFRSTKEQAALYNELGPSKAARPGTSLHEFGLALDVQSTDLEQLDKLGLLRKYGFTRPLGSETWHIEPAGIHNNAVRQRAKKDHAFATDYIESGVGRGGGGLGSKGKSGGLRRDDDYAKMLFDAGSKQLKDKTETSSAPAPSAVSKMVSEMTGGNNPGPLSSDKSQLATGMSEVETKDGKVPSSAGSGNASAKSMDSIVKSSNDDLNKTSYDLTSHVKGTVGGYESLPDSTGKGWTGNGLLIREAAKIVGVDPALAAAIAAKESSLNPGAQANGGKGTNPAQGMYQFKPGTWSDMMKKYASKYGIKPNTSPLDPRANALLGMEYIKASMKSGDGSNADAYIGHLLGSTGASRFRAMKGEDIPANSFKSAAADNLNLFYENGNKSKPYTKTQLLSSIDGSLNKQLSEFGIPMKLTSVKQAANDDTVKENKDTPETSAQSPLKATTDKPVIANAKYTPPPAPKAATRVEPSAETSTPLYSMSKNAPARATTSTTKPIENNNNGIAHLEKVTAEYIVEQKRSNDILVEIRDLLAKGFASGNLTQGSTKSNSTPSENPSTQPNNNLNKKPVELPDSYIQRRRA